MAASQALIADGHPRRLPAARAIAPHGCRRRRGRLPGGGRRRRRRSDSDALRPAGGRRSRRGAGSRGPGSRAASAAAAASCRTRCPPGADTISPGAGRPRPRRRTGLALLAAAHAALAPGGTLLLAEPMAGTPGAEPVGDAYFGFYLLAMGSGRCRAAPRSSRALLREAGFAQRAELRDAPSAAHPRARRPRNQTRVSVSLT